MLYMLERLFVCRMHILTRLFVQFSGEGTFGRIYFGRLKGCASVFLIFSRQLFCSNELFPYQDRITHSTYLSKLTTSGVLKVR